MADTQTIIDAAKKIGKMVSAHEATKRLESSLKSLESDPDAQNTIAEFNKHLQALAQKEQAGKPIEPEDKRKLESLQQSVVMNINLRNFQMAQMDYVDLLRKVDEAITGESGDAMSAIGAGGEGGGGDPAGGQGQGPAASPLVNPDLMGGR